MKKKLFCFITLLMASTIIVGCQSDVNSSNDEPQLPTFGTPENYASEGDLTVTFDSFGYTFDITIDGTKVENYTYDAVAKALTIPESALKGLELGTHTITAVTPVGNFSTKFIKVDKRIAEFVSNEVSYTSEEDETVSLSGTFSEGLSVLSVKQVDKQYTSSEDQSWDYAHADLEKNYVDLVTLTNGLDGKGSLTLSNEFLSLFWGDTQFDVEFSNGATLRFTLKSDVLAFSNYDDTTIYGYCGGVAQTNHGFQSGLNNGAIANIEEREEGNKALYIRSTENAAVATVFTQKYREHPWNWFYTPITNGNYTRVTFTYQLSNLPQNSAYFTVTLDPSENVAEKFFGDYDEVGNLLDFKIVKFYLKADGQVHTFDSGWFRNDLDYRMNRVDLPYFGPSSNAFAMFDDYKVVQTTSLPTDDREGSLTETSKNVSYNDKDVTLAGSFDETLKVASLIRYGADGVWDNGGNPVSIDTSYVTITKDGLKIADELINKLYGTTRFVLTFDNRKSVEFTLTTNVIYSSDYDKFNAFVDLPGNSVICQDRAMIDVVSVDGNRKIKFTPFNAVQGHSVSAINGSLTQDNGAFTFANPNKESAWWYNINVADDETFFIFFDYEVYAADKTPNYQVRWKDASGEWHAIPLTNSGSFYLELSGAEFAAIFINCPANQASEVEGTYMYIDNFGVGKK